MQIRRGLIRSFSDFRRHPWLHAVSVMTIAISLLILGVFFLGYRNIEHIADKARSQGTGTVYLKDGLSPEQVSALSDRARAMPGVVRVEFKSRASVLDEIEGFLGSTETQSLTSEALFPDVLEVEVRKDLTPEQVSDVKAMLSIIPEVAETDFSEDWMAQLTKLRRVFNIIGVVLMVGIIIGCGFIIANFMGMRHQARREEIDVVRLHGAHRNFILAPFFVEGLIEGIAGASIAVTLLYILKSLAGAVITVNWASALGLKELLYLSPGQLATVYAVGIAMAFFGSIAVFLRFQEHSAR